MSELQRLYDQRDRIDRIFIRFLIALLGITAVCQLVIGVCNIALALGYE